jgi:beta-glucosidase
MSPELGFPDGFLLGVGTAAYQVEGAASEDGKGQSIWDSFSHQPGAIFHGDNGDIACDQYHRIAEDVDLMAELHVPLYRFSIAWPRVQPEGKGSANQVGLDHYRHLVDLLLERGIAPAVTLYHWDLPEALQQAGGWANRETAYRFGDYAAIVADALGDQVAIWTTVNEPWVAAFLGHAAGTHAPGIHDLRQAVLASHHLLLGHGVAARAIVEQVGTPALVGITLNLAPVSAASNDPADLAAALRLDAHLNRCFLDPVLRGSYPELLHAEYERIAGETFCQDGDLALIHARNDFLGVNYYMPRRVAARRVEVDTADEASPYELWLGIVDRLEEGLPQTTKGWAIKPGGLTELLVGLHAEYGAIPIYVTENGAAFADYVDPGGAVKDPERITYLREHLLAVHAAISGGVDVRGYFVWSLLDNFEWADGYSQRFGLVFVEFGTQRRIPKTSARWFSEVATTHAVSVE